MRYTFDEYLFLVTEAAGQRVDRAAVEHFYNKGAAVMDCVVAVTYRHAPN